MKDETRFRTSVSILVKAFQNDTLIYGDICACAIGNLVAANLGYKVAQNGKYWLDENEKKVALPEWPSIHHLGNFRESWQSKVHGMKEIEATGYSPDQTLQIEKVFEEKRHHSSPSDSFDGLMAVIDELLQIHEAAAEEITEVHSLFNNHQNVTQPEMV